jgi:hypothetical protein
MLGIFASFPIIACAGQRDLAEVYPKTTIRQAIFGLQFLISR